MKARSAKGFTLVPWRSQGTSYRGSASSSEWCKMGIFATFVLGVDLVEWVMSLQAEALRASPWADVFKQEGEQKGEQKGKQKEALRMLNILLKGRFGDVSESVQAAMHLLRTDQLEELAELFLLSNSLDEFIAHLARVRDEN